MERIGPEIGSVTVSVLLVIGYPLGLGVLARLRPVLVDAGQRIPRTVRRGRQAQAADLPPGGGLVGIGRQREQQQASLRSGMGHREGSGQDGAGGVPDDHSPG